MDFKILIAVISDIWKILPGSAFSSLSSFDVLLLESSAF